jgi:hypothetical protein
VSGGGKKLWVKLKIYPPPSKMKWSVPKNTFSKFTSQIFRDGFVSKLDFIWIFALPHISL